MNLSSINKLFSSAEFQDAIISYQAYAISNQQMANVSIFNANISKDKLEQQLINQIKNSKPSKSELIDSAATDSLLFPKIYNFEPTALADKNFTWYKFDFVVFEDSKSEPLKIKIPVGLDKDYLIYAEIDCKFNKLSSCIILMQSDDGLESSFKGSSKIGAHEIAYAVRTISPLEMFSELLFGISNLLNISSKEWLAKSKSLDELTSIFGENFERTYFENFFEDRLIENSLESLYCKKLVATATSVIKSQFGLQILPAPEVINIAEILVDSKDKLGHGINFHIEGVNIISSSLVFHGWMIDASKEIRSIQIIDPTSQAPIEMVSKLLKFERLDVVTAFGLSGSPGTLLNGFLAVLDTKNIDTFKNINQVSIKFITKNNKCFIDKPKISIQPENLHGVAHIFGALPDDEMNAERCEKFFRPIFTSLAKSTFDLKNVFVETCGNNQTKIKPLLSIIIPLYGDIRFELTQIPTLASLKSDNFEIIFAVDDRNTLEVVVKNVQRLSNLYGLSIKVIAPESNLGFAGINNLASKYAQGDYLLFLNSDCFVTQISPLLNAIDWLKKPNHGAVGFRLLYADQTIQHEGMCVTKWNNSTDFYLNDHPDLGIPSNLKQAGIIKNNSTMLTAACLMIPKLTFSEVGGFNRIYFRGDFEDSDLCLKIISRGKRLGLVQSNHIYHLERQSISSQEPGLRQKITLINSYIYSQRWKAMLSKGLPLLEAVS